MTFEPILSSVVALRSQVPEDAFTAGGLGTLREGSGVVIGENGLVLTIGYLITEAEEVWLTTQDGRVVPGACAGLRPGDRVRPRAGARRSSICRRSSSAACRMPSSAIPWSSPTDAAQSVKAAIVAKQEFAGYWEYLLDEAHLHRAGASLMGRRRAASMPRASCSASAR